MRFGNLGLALMVGMGACGGGESGVPPVDPPIPCPSGNCGNESFRRAIPSQDTVRIRFGAQGRRAPGAAGHEPGGGTALEALSPAYDSVDAYVGDINGDIDDIFAGLEELAQATPEIAEDTLHQWRVVDDLDPTLDEVLTVASDDGVTYTLDYAVGPTGFDPANAAPILYGTVHVSGDEKEDFDVTIDLDALTAIVPEADATGDIDIRMQPFAGGFREIWYDLDAVSVGGDPLETSITTYWIFDDGSGALEYLADFDGAEATVYARWSDAGGRYDHHAWYQDPELGPVDEIMTDCWDPLGGQTFSAWAAIDASATWYGAIDGDELDCVYGPVEDHPDPGADFDDLPAEGEWDDVAFETVGPAPLCEEDPADPDCIPFCEDDPADLDCVWFCDVYPDDPSCA